MIEKIDESGVKIVGEIRELRGDLSFDNEWKARIERDIQAIKAKIGIK